MRFDKRRFLVVTGRTGIFLLGILIPLASFWLSTSLSPLWKGGAKFDFLSLLITSKLFLLPLVLWAVVSFFRTQIFPRKEPARWETVGLSVGVIAAIFSFLSGFFSQGVDFLAFPIAFLAVPFSSLQTVLESPYLLLQLLVVGPIFFLLAVAPFYTPIWYGWAAWEALRKRKQQAVSNTAIASFISLPFMGAAMIYAQRLYEQLPNTAPDCFVVTATAMTPTRFVSTIPHPETGLQLSRQLLTFKAFEYAWIQSTSISHPVFRAFYNIVGPILASLIRSHSSLATFSYFGIKPVEFAALKYLELLQKK